MSLNLFGGASALTIATDATLVVLSALAVWVHFLIEPVRWSLCYLPDRSSPARNRVRDALYCTAMATYFLPFKLGVPLRVVLVKRASQLSTHYIGVVLVVDAVIGLVCWTAIASICAWLAVVRMQLATIWWVAGGAMVVVLVLLVACRKIGRRLFEKFVSAVRELSGIRLRIAYAFVFLGIDVLSYGIRHALLGALVLGGDAHRWVVCGELGIISTFAGILSGLPMGLLGYDASFIGLMSVAGFSPESAVAIILINRLLNLGVAVVLGLPAALRLRLGSSIAEIVRRLRKIPTDER